MDVLVEQKPLEHELCKWLPHQERIIIDSESPEIEKVWAFVDAAMRAIYSCVNGNNLFERTHYRTFCHHCSFELCSILAQAGLLRGINLKDWEQYHHTQQQLEEEIQELEWFDGEELPSDEPGVW